MIRARTAASRAMAVRLGLVMLSIALLAAGAASWLGARSAAAQRAAHLVEHRLTASRSVASELSARLQGADALARAFSALDAGADGSRLRQRWSAATALRGAVLLPWSAATTGVAAPVALYAGDRLALRSGQTLLKSTMADDGQRAVYLLRTTTMAGMPAVAYLELDPAWLWGGLGLSTEQHRLALFDSLGPLQSSTPLTPALRRELQRLPVPDAATGTPLASGWLADGVEWRGATALATWDTQLRGEPWRVISFDAPTDVAADWSAFGAGAPLLILIMLLSALCGAAYCLKRWQPALERLGESLQRLEDGHFDVVQAPEARDLPAQLVRDYNQALLAHQRRQRSLACLNEIDRLLLEPQPLENALDRVLKRVCAITGCHAAGLILAEPNAPGHGRAFTAVAEGAEQPVTRVAIDAALAGDLVSHDQPMTVTRCEPQRHSMLDPLGALGCQYYWLWPVCAEARMQAVLVVGYLQPPMVAEEWAEFGTECAARLALAIRNNVRDDELYRRAHFDALTNLPNRLLFRDRLSQELASVSRSGRRGALLYVDLDHFKRVNDASGHAAGDQLLQVVAQRLRTCVQDGDTVARLAGDEFTVVLRQAGSTEVARLVAERIQKALQQPVTIAGREHTVRASIGITLFPDDGSEIDDLMRNADLAMYQAKELGRGQVAQYTPSMQQTAVALDSGLFRALRRREFSLYYQPQYALKDNRLVGLEALLRWNLPRQPIRLPGEFIPAAEQSGLIVDIGAWVLETACQQLGEWRRAGIAPPQLALNVSVHQLRQGSFPALVKRNLERNGIPPETLEIELTESVFADEEARQNMQQLVAMGLKLSLDDFGTGYSSLGYLRQHPVQAIKIDRSFIEEVPHSITASTLAETMIVMAHALGKQVVAEGVETQEQLDFLRERRCDVAQGYFLSHPRNLNDISSLLGSIHAPVAARRQSA